MYTISRLSKLSKCSEKAIRLYEKMGLLKNVKRSENNYRFYSAEHLKTLKLISNFKKLGLKLQEIDSILQNQESEAILSKYYLKKLQDTEQEIVDLEKRKNELKSNITITQLISGKKIKGVTMEKDLLQILNLKQDALKRFSNNEQQTKDFLSRENFFDSELKLQFIEDVKKTVDFIQRTKIKVGPLRGTCSSSLVLELLGLNSINPLKYNLIPERFNKDNLYLDFDVEFVRGSEFIWFCKELTSNRTYKFEAYKLPIIDIIASTEKRIKKKINPSSINDFENYFKKMICKGDFQYISMVDFPSNTLCYKFFEKENNLWNQNDNLIKLSPQNEFEIWGYLSMEGRIVAKEKLDHFLNNKPDYLFEKLPLEIQKIMKKNRGHLLYQEEWIQILALYLKNDFEKAEKTRILYRKQGKSALDELNIPEKVNELLIKNFDSLFNFSHIASTWQHAKMTAYLKQFHRDIYLDEIEKFESQTNFSWADFGFKSKGLILMQD